MLNLQQLAIDRFVDELQRAYRQTYSDTMPEFGNLVVWTGRLALENIANTDALYHNVEHTMMVALVGQAILKGKHLCEGGVTPRDWAHFMMALLCHDIGYVRGICAADRDSAMATGFNGETILFSSGGSDAALAPHHVDRAKLFIVERFGRELLIDVDADLIASYIEMTRFPLPSGSKQVDTADYPGLVRAADYIGQLGDPNYLRKIPALYYEFVETGEYGSTLYQSPGDMRRNYAKFFWNTVNPFIQGALRFLRVTQEGKQWIANLHSHVFDIEHSSV